jgi:hypothetical protein
MEGGNVSAKPELNAHEITDRQQCGKVDLQGRDPRKLFFMAISVGNLDGSVEEPAGEGVEAIEDTEAAALQRASFINAEYPTLEVYVYKCIPVARAWRGKTRIQKLKP